MRCGSWIANVRSMIKWIIFMVPRMTNIQMITTSIAQHNYKPTFKAMPNGSNDFWMPVGMDLYSQ